MSTRRKNLSARTRFEVFKRDAFQCGYCGRTPPAVVLHVDHVVPVCDGGGNEAENLLTSCSECNLGKGPVPLGVVSASLAQVQAEAEERAAQVAAYNEFLRSRQAARQSEVAALATIWLEEVNRRSRVHFWTFSESSARSVSRFLDRLPFETVRAAMELAKERVPTAAPVKRGRKVAWDDSRRWRYFCKVCWNQINGEGRPI